MRHLNPTIEREVVQAIKGLDRREARRCYRDQNEFVMLDRFLTRPVADQLLREVDVLASDVNRKYVPGHKKGGSVSFYVLLKHAPAILSLPVHLFQICRRSGARTGSVSDCDALD
jgi:hypothetical protein